MSIAPKSSSNSPEKYWWVTLLRAVMAYGLGISMLLSNPPRAMFVNYMGLFWLTSGLASIAWGRRETSHKWLWIIAGIIETLGGALVLLRRFTGNAIPIETAVKMFAIIAIFTGFLHIFGGFRQREDLRRQWSWESFILGVVEVGLGVLVFISGADLSPTIRTAAILWALAGGTGMLLRSLRLREKYRQQNPATG